MKIGRNDPCPCGSGKKYKKCCLATDEARQTQFHRQIAKDAASTEPSWDLPEPEALPDTEDYAEPDADEDSALDPNQEPPPPVREYPQVDQTLPELSPEDQALVDQWWKDALPSYKELDADEMLSRVEGFLEAHPALFPHLWLNEEFLFELGAELGRRQQWPVYARLLQRLRREQPTAYAFSFGYFDYDVIIEQILTGQTEEISPFLSYFKQYPDSQPDQCHALANLLAWRGLASPLCELAEAVAVPMLTSRNVINGGFALDWLIRREFVSFLETRDDSESAAGTILERLHALSTRLDLKLTPSLPDIHRKLKMAAAPPTIMELSQYKPRDHHFLEDLEWNFGGYLCAHQAVNWTQARFAAEQLDHYVWWHGERNHDPFGFRPAEVEHCLVQTSRSFIALDGVRAVSMLQMLAWFVDYLKAAGGISETKRRQVRDLARSLFDQARRSVDSTDPAYRLCPVFEQLAPEGV